MVIIMEKKGGMRVKKEVVLSLNLHVNNRTIVEIEKDKPVVIYKININNEIILKN